MLSARAKCSHRCVSPKESLLKPVQSLQYASGKSTEQTSMKTKWFKHIAIETVQEHFLVALSVSRWAPIVAHILRVSPCEGASGP